METSMLEFLVAPFAASHFFSAASIRPLKSASRCSKKARSFGRSCENLSAIALAIRLPFSGSIQ